MSFFGSSLLALNSLRLVNACPSRADVGPERPHRLAERRLYGRINQTALSIEDRIEHISQRCSRYTEHGTHNDLVLPLLRRDCGQQGSVEGLDGQTSKVRVERAA